MGKNVDPKYLVDQESFNFAEYWIDTHIEEEGEIGHSESLHHKWELANEIQMCVEEYFHHNIYGTYKDSTATDGGLDAGLSETESPAGDATARTAGRVGKLVPDPPQERE